MSLSIKKLEKLLETCSLKIVRILSMENLCRYIEISNNDGSNKFLLYILSKYEIHADKTYEINKIQYIDINTDGNIPNDFAGAKESLETENVYENINISNSSQKDTVQNYLEENYNTAISIDDINVSDLNNLREIFRQLKRLGLCVKNIKYKFCIFYKNYLCCIRRDDSFEGFIVQTKDPKSDYNLIVSIDLESFYEKLASISDDIISIRMGAYKILEKNNIIHMNKLQKMLEEKENLIFYSTNIIKKKEQYLEYFKKLQNMFEHVKESEKQIHKKILELNSQDAYDRGLRQDINRTHQMGKLESELQRIKNLKVELVQNILNVQNKYDNICLKTDKVFFDNIVMSDAIIKNILSLANI